MQNSKTPLLSSKKVKNKAWFIKRLIQGTGVTVKVEDKSQIKRLRNDLYHIAMNYSSVNGLGWKIAIRKVERGIYIGRVDLDSVQ